MKYNIKLKFGNSQKRKKILEQLHNSPNFKPNPGKGDKSFYDRMKEFFQ